MCPIGRLGHQRILNWSRRSPSTHGLGRREGGGKKEGCANGSELLEALPECENLPTRACYTKKKGRKERTEARSMRTLAGVEDERGTCREQEHVDGTFAGSSIGIRVRPVGSAAVDSRNHLLPRRSCR